MVKITGMVMFFVTQQLTKYLFVSLINYQAFGTTRTPALRKTSTPAWRVTRRGYWSWSSRSANWRSDRSLQVPTTAIIFPFLRALSSVSAWLTNIPVSVNAESAGMLTAPGKVPSLNSSAGLISRQIAF